MKLAQQMTRKESTVLFCLTTLFALCITTMGFCGVGKAKEESLKKIEESVDRDRIKMKLHAAADSLNKETVHETIDKVASYLDREKLKQGVDEISEYLSPERIRELLDYAAENLSKEKVKEVIDDFADALDREKLKEAVDQFVAALDLDKQRIKQTLDDSVDKVATSFQDVADTLEHELECIQHNTNAIYDTVQKYNWNQWLLREATYGPATLSGLKLGSMKKPVAVARAGEKVEGEVVCSFDRDQCAALSMYRVVLGIKNRGGQTSVFNHFGIRAGKEIDHFTLTAPKEKGIYQVGFRVVEAARADTAIKCWDDRNAKGEGEPVVIGLLIVV